MFRNILQRLKELLYKMNLIRGLNDVAQHKELNVNEELYDHIDKWKRLYKGYLKEWHDLKYQTIEGTQTRKMDTLNMPKIVSEEMARLIFNEKCEINISDEQLNENIKAIFKKERFYKKFQDYLEYMFAMGGQTIKPYVEDGVLKLSYTTADCFIPITWHNDTITEGVFLDETHKGKYKYTLLEWHLKNGNQIIIRNDLYRSEQQDLGIQVPLSELYPNLDEEVIINNVEQPIFTYFKPNIANNIDLTSPLGISIFGNALDTMKMLDTQFDSFNREFRLGKKRILVPNHMVKMVVDPNTGQMVRYFDATDETYEAFNGSEMDEDTIRDISVELRVEEHISAINATLNLLAMQTGFSAGTFSFDGQSVKTATEVVSEQSKTFKTKQSHETIIEAGIQELIQSICDVAQLYNLFPVPSEFEVSVSFDDSIAEDKTSEVTRIAQELNNRLTPRKRAIMEYHGLTDDEAEQWLEEINAEQETATSREFFGGDE